MFPPLRTTLGAAAEGEERDQTGIDCNYTARADSAMGVAGSLCQTRSRITATSVMPSAARLGTITAAPEAKASIATQSNGLSTKRGTIRSSFPNDTQRIPNRFRSSVNHRGHGPGAVAGTWTFSSLYHVP